MPYSIRAIGSQMPAKVSSEQLELIRAYHGVFRKQFMSMEIGKIGHISQVEYCI
jgi:hypothetical protein